MKKVIIAIAALAMIASSAYAADWNFYGSARVSTFYETTKKDNTADVDGFAQALQSNSRIGANVKVSDELSGRFEYGASDGNANVRLLYGEWNFGAGSLLVGQDWTPLVMWNSSQTWGTDNGLWGVGEYGGHRLAQLKLKIGGFRLALMAPDVDFMNIDGAKLNSEAAAGDSFSTEVTIPAIALKYIFSADNYNLKAIAGYSSFEIIDAAGNKDVDSYVVGVGADISFGKLWIGTSIHAGSNVGNLGTEWVNNTYTGTGYAKYEGGVLTDNDAIGYQLVVVYTVSDMIGLEAGYGHCETELDDDVSGEDKVDSYYIQAPVTLAPGVVVTPEIGVVDWQEDGEKTTYFGAKWQINF